MQAIPFRLPLAALCLIAATAGRPAIAGGSWLLDGRQARHVRIAADDPNALHTDGARPMLAPLVFDPSLSSPTTGLFKATVPWDAVYDFFAFNPARETVVLSPSADIGLEAGELSIRAATIELPGAASIEFSEQALHGGWWISDILDEPEAIINRAFADSRYILRTEGITTNLLLQPGHTLQIQNGIITAINP